MLIRNKFRTKRIQRKSMNYFKRFSRLCAHKRRFPERFLLRTQNKCLIGKKTDHNHFWGVIYSYAFLPIIQTLDISK